MVSFIVPAYDEEQLIGETLDAIHDSARAVGEPYEVIVVDDASTDRTAEVAVRKGARLLPVYHRQIAATRNAGAKHASGEILIFVDADTLVTARVVRAAIAALRGGAVGGGCAGRFSGRIPLYARLLQAVLDRVYRIQRVTSGCFLFCGRREFEAAGGFDETLYGAEEFALIRALRRRGRFVILRDAVATSGRKLRTHGPREVLGIVLRIALRGRRGVARRNGLEIWYGERRHDPIPPRVGPV